MCTAYCPCASLTLNAWLALDVTLAGFFSTCEWNDSRRLRFLSSGPSAGPAVLTIVRSSFCIVFGFKEIGFWLTRVDQCMFKAIFGLIRVVDSRPAQLRHVSHRELSRHQLPTAPINSQYERQPEKPCSVTTQNKAYITENTGTWIFTDSKYFGV